MKNLINAFPTISTLFYSTHLDIHHNAKFGPNDDGHFDKQTCSAKEIRSCLEFCPSSAGDSPNSPYFVLQYDVAVDSVLDSGHGRNHGT